MPLLAETHWYLPQTNAELTKFYFIICIAYLLVHIIWDVFSTATPRFSLVNLQYKMSTVCSSSTFATSLFFVVIIFDLENPLRQEDVFAFPLILSSIICFMVSVSAIVPKPEIQHRVERGQ
ncbi:hypothetical protein J2125_004615 [Erwinia toletana]|uniref:Uncharacterized protein n=1 Tax=Winslowiella toletana TaxID=92490 RepID=A0ABS4PFJ2_9GAMM|nr:hypothetical protein [Winslowiella toletana]MBP2171423.1 hypothetical protein [Winslowiella toletana]